MLSIQCPRCDSDNCLSGDCDIDGFECHQCQQRFLIAELDEQADLAESIHAFVGKTRPFESDEEEYLFDVERSIHPRILERLPRIYQNYGNFVLGINH